MGCSQTSRHGIVGRQSVDEYLLAESPPLTGGNSA